MSLNLLKVKRELAIVPFGSQVQLMFGRTVLGLQHRDAAQFSQWIRLHAKHCAARNHDTKRRLAVELDEKGEWHGTTELWEGSNLAADAPLAQATGVVVANHLDLVVMRIGSLCYGMHYNDATIYSEAMRAIAETVRRSSGDPRTLMAAGILTDAEDNYRRGV